VRRSLSPRDIAAAMRMLRDERTVAVRNVLERWGTASQAATGKRKANRAAPAPQRPVAGHHPS